MFKILFLFLFISLSLFANRINFKEEKYINALQTSVYKNGTLTIEEKTIILTYPEKEISFYFNKDNIIKKNGTSEEILEYEDNLELTIFSKIIESIYKDESNNLAEYFEIKKEKEKVVLLPNDYISNAISKIEYNKTGSKLEFLKIYFTNEDWINIVETN